MKLVVSLLSALFLAAPAFARCPTPADMARGVVVTFDNGGSETFSRQSHDWVEGASGFWRTSLIHGLYFSSSLPSLGPAPAGGEATGVLIMPPADAAAFKRYDDPTGALPRPEPGVRIVITSTAVAMPMVADAEDVFVTGPRGTATIGTCPLSAFSVDHTETLRQADGAVVDVTRTQMVYLADLGFAVSTSQQDEHGPGWARAPVSIEAVE